MARELPKVYEPNQVEEKIYQMWLDNGCFKAEAQPQQKTVFHCDSPPNITGQLHMGHALDNALQDILIRTQENAGITAPCGCRAPITPVLPPRSRSWSNMAEEGLTKTRHWPGKAFLERAWQWKEKYGGRIVEQLKKLGASCDWDRKRLPWMRDAAKAVHEVFVRAVRQRASSIRGNRIINWCPDCAHRFVRRRGGISRRQVRASVAHPL